MSSLKNRTMGIAESILALLQEEAKGADNASVVIKTYIHISLCEKDKAGALMEIIEAEKAIHESQLKEDFTLEQSKELLSRMKQAVTTSRSNLKRAEKLGQIWGVLEEA